MLAGVISVWIADNFVHHLYIDEKNVKAAGFYKQKGCVEKRGEKLKPERTFCLNRKQKYRAKECHMVKYI